jgi:hypothetical protein
MTVTIEELRRAMEAAAGVGDYEEAARLRDRIALLRGGASPESAAAADTSGIDRQQPGAMGLGSSRQRPVPPAGWTPPRKPDPMTTGRSRRGKRGG